MANQIPEEIPTEVLNRIEQLAENKVTPVADDTTKWKYDGNYHKLADFLGVKQEDKMSEDLARQISFLRDYVQTDDELEAQIRLMQLQRRIGIQSKGKELVNVLYRYARLQQERDDIDKRMMLTIQQSQNVSTT